MVHIGNPDQYAFKISPVGGINWATTTQTDVTQAANQAASFSQSSGLGYAVGLLVAYSPIPVWDLETGVIFSHHKTITRITSPDKSVLARRRTTTLNFRSSLATVLSPF